jgi:hypothetical protein
MKVKEFKMWLEGVLAFQEDKESWKPTAKQWKTILQKIEELEEGIHLPERGQQQHPNGTMPMNNAIPVSLEDYARSPTVAPSYTVHTPEQLEALKRTATGSGIVDVPIVNADKYQSPFA